MGVVHKRLNIRLEFIIKRRTSNIYSNALWKFVDRLYMVVVTVQEAAQPKHLVYMKGLRQKSRKHLDDEYVNDPSTKHVEQNV